MGDDSAHAELHQQSQHEDVNDVDSQGARGERHHEALAPGAWLMLVEQLPDEDEDDRCREHEETRTRDHHVVCRVGNAGKPGGCHRRRNEAQESQEVDADANAPCENVRGEVMAKNEVERVAQGQLDHEGAHELIQ